MSNEKANKYELPAELIKSIAHPVRLKILHVIHLYKETNVTQIKEILDLPQPTISQHLSRMQRGGVLERKKRGTEVFYTLVNEDLLLGLNHLCKINYKITSNKHVSFIAHD